MSAVPVAGLSIGENMLRRSPLRASRRRVPLPVWCVGLAAAAGALYLFAIAVRRFSEAPQNREALLRTGWELFDPDAKLLVEATVLVLGLVAACFVRLPSRDWARNATARFRRLSFRRRESILLAALVPIVLRLAVLPVASPPTPKVADEFGYLLLADTFASGRITNPPHKLWPHFETLYVLQQPTRASIYPAAPGLTMAAAQAGGFDPWVGVWASVGAMCACLCWMLQGWLPPPWALLGALLAGIRVGYDSYWMNSYWGGAVPAIGGALVLGALPRALRRNQVPAALIMGLGLFILAQSRPFEGVLLCVPVGLAVTVAFFRKPVGSRGTFARRVLLPLAGAGALIAAVTLYYNWRVTGNAFLLPYQLHQQVYGTPQNLRWAPEVADAPRAHIHKDIADNFEWQREMFRGQTTLAGMADKLRLKIQSFWKFYLGAGLTIPFLVLGLLGRKVRFLSVTALFAFFGVALLYPFFFPHYVAPVFGATLAVTMYGLRRIRLLRWRRRPVGRRWLPWVIASSVAGAATSAAGWTILVSAVSLETTPRSNLEAELKRLGGSHVVFVRYGSSHLFHSSWIYNAADPDQAPIVWARDLGTPGNRELLRYYDRRDAWIADVDENPPGLIPYEDKDRPRIRAVLNAAGKSPYFKEGIAPGSIVTIFGRNLAPGITGAAAADSFRALPSLDTVFPSMQLVRNQSEAKPLALDGVSIQFGRVPARIFAASNIDSQESVTVQVPFDLRGDRVTLRFTRGVENREVELPVLPANPGIFQVPLAGGRLSGALLRPDGSLVSTVNPAVRGETIRMLVTGLGRDPVGQLIIGVNHRGAAYRWTQRGSPLVGADTVAFEVPREAPSGPEIPLSMAVVVNGKPVYSNGSSIAIE